MSMEHRLQNDQRTSSSIGSNRSIERNEVLLPADSVASPTLTVVMPTLNEEEGIGECITRIKNALNDIDVHGEIIVSDSSTDRTAEIARENGAIVVEPDKHGYGYAYRYAFEHARGDYIAIGDADTTYDFEELPKLYRLVANGQADMAMGSRLDGEIKSSAMPPLHKYVGNPLLTKFLNLFYGAGVTDAHSGLRLLSEDTLEQLQLRASGMEFASEMIMQAGAQGLSVEEVPITYHEREGEATLDSFRDGWRHVKFMLVNAPGPLFTGPAAVCSALGLSVMVLSIFGTHFAGVTFGVHTAIGGSLLTIIGYQIGCLALFTSVATDPIQKLEYPLIRLVRRHFQLEHGATLGILLFGVGAAYLTTVAGSWVATGRVPNASVVPNMLGFTAVVIGAQTVFNSCFLSMLAQQRMQ